MREVRGHAGSQIRNRGAELKGLLKLAYCTLEISLLLVGEAKNPVPPSRVRLDHFLALFDRVIIPLGINQVFAHSVVGLDTTGVQLEAPPGLRDRFFNAAGTAQIVR